MHDKMEMMNNEDHKRQSQATRRPRNFLLEKEKSDLLPLLHKKLEVSITLNEMKSM